MSEQLNKLQEIAGRYNLALSVEPQEDGIMVYGPFLSFILLIENTGTIRSLIHVNADAANMILIFNEFAKELNIVQDGAFAVNSESGDLIMGNDAYSKKEDNILMLAREIIERRQEARQELIVPEKKIILAS